jgi:hypothetical protein
MFDPSTATPEQRQAWRVADRYSLAQIADLADHAAFNARRTQMRVREIRRGLRAMFRRESGFSTADLAYLFEQTRDRDALLVDVLAEACWHLAGDEPVDDRQPLAGGRILHTVGSALGWWAGREATTFSDALPQLGELLSDTDRAALASLGLTPEPQLRIGAWADRAREAGFASLRQVIVQVRERGPAHPLCRLRSDEVVWGRVPARLDLGGGWTDTPPYSLEQGGCVINAAVNLNGQPPIHCYARVVKEPVIRIGSIDLGTRREITELAHLLDYRQATSDFALAKAALALSGFSPETAAWPTGATLQEMLRRFGGGIELTTLAAVPKGSGLGTSSIMGTVILAVVQRVMGRSLDRDEIGRAHV